MLLKMVGAGLVIFGCSALGIGYGRGLKGHLEEVRFFRELYCMIAKEIEYTRAPLPEVMLEVAGRIKEPYASLFRQSYQAFEKEGSFCFPEWFRRYADATLGAYRKEKRISEEEWAQFLELGSQTGYLDLQMQIGMLKLAGERWDAWTRLAEEEIGPKKRIGHCMGVLGGVFLAILLL